MILVKNMRRDERTENSVYIGRPNRAKLPLPVHYGNPFSHLPMQSDWIAVVSSPEVAVDHFDKWLNALELPNISEDFLLRIEDRRQWILDQLRDHKLIGMELFCWCNEGAPCHGHVLARMQHEVLDSET